MGEEREKRVGTGGKEKRKKYKERVKRGGKEGK